MAVPPRRSVHPEGPLGTCILPGTRATFCPAAGGRFPAGAVRRGTAGVPTPGSPCAAGCHIGVTVASTRLAAAGQGSTLKGLLINNRPQPPLKQTLWCWVNRFPLSQTRAPFPAAFTGFSAFHDMPLFQPTKQSSSSKNSSQI